jgi:hypothetical protein
MAIRPGRLVQRKMGTVTGVLFNVACAEIDSDNSDLKNVLDNKYAERGIISCKFCKFLLAFIGTDIIIFLV